MNINKNNISRLLTCILFMVYLVSSVNSVSGQNCVADFVFTETSSNTLEVFFESMSSPVDSVISYKWDYGDGNSDSSSQFQFITHQYDTSGVYEVCLSILAMDSGNLCDNTYCEFIEVCANPMWPGDANNDGLANNFDILPLGLMFGTNGVASVDTSVDWEPRCIGDWADSIVGTIVNLKHADGNGNGFIDSGDVSAINLNYGLTHNKTASSPCLDPADPPLFFVFSETIVEAGTAVDVDIHLGTVTDPVADAYGIVFSVLYDPNLVDSNSMVLNYDNSIFQDTVMPAITIQNDQFSSGRIDGGIIRTDFQSISGFGPVGRLSFVMEDDLVQRPEDLSDSLIELPFILEFSDILLVDQINSPIDLCSKTDSIVVFQLISGIDPGPNPGIANVNIRPNPFNQYVSVSSPEMEIYQASLYDVLGRQVFDKNNESLPNEITLDLSELSSGVYLIRVRTENGEFVRKLIKD